jgi:hypothetical protein
LSNISVAAFFALATTAGFSLARMSSSVLAMLFTLL